jgi:hypothetical protein
MDIALVNPYAPVGATTWGYIITISRGKQAQYLSFQIDQDLLQDM